MMGLLLTLLCQNGVWISKTNSYAGVVQYNNDTVLSIYDVGKIIVAGASGSNFTLPDSGTVAVGSRLSLMSQGGLSTIIASGTDKIYIGSGFYSSTQFGGFSYMSIYYYGYYGFGRWVVDQGPALNHPYYIGSSWGTLGGLVGVAYCYAGTTLTAGGGQCQSGSHMDNSVPIALGQNLGWGVTATNSGWYFSCSTNDGTLTPASAVAICVSY